MFTIRNFSLKIAAACLTVAWLAACTQETPTPPPTLIPTPTVITVQLASELAPLRVDISACAAAIGDSGALVFEAPAPLLPEDETGVTLRIGFPEGFEGRAVQIGTEEILVVAGSGEQLGELSADEVEALFEGAQADALGAERPLEVWVPLEGSESRRLLDALMKEQEYSPNAFLSPGPSETFEVLKAMSGAVGVLPGAWATADLQVLYSFGAQPVLALTVDEPEGKVREFLGCLQTAVDD